MRVPTCFKTSKSSFCDSFWSDNTSFNFREGRSVFFRRGFQWIWWGELIISFWHKILWLGVHEDHCVHT